MSTQTTADPTLTITTLHTEAEPVPEAATVVQGRVNYRPPSGNAPRNPAPPPAITAAEARRLILNGLTNTLKAASQLPEAERAKSLEQLLRGSSHTGFVQTTAGVRVNSVEGLRSLIMALHRMTTAKVFGHNSKQLFFFTVPRGWLAYAGDVKVDSLVRFYLRKDRKLEEARLAWEKAKDAAIAAGQPVPPEVPAPQYTAVPGTNTKWGPWVTLLRNGTHPDFIEMLVPGPDGPQRELKPVLVNENAPLHKARTLTFVVDTKTGQLVAWQAGRYVADMTPAQRADRVILAGGAPTEEELHG